MNNKLLYLNLKNINNIVLLDDACDEIEFSNWDHDVDEGGVPQVIYDSIGDYFTLTDEERKAEFSPTFLKKLQNFLDFKGIDELQAHLLTNGIYIHHIDGTTKQTDFSVDEYENLSVNIEHLYQSGFNTNWDKFWSYSDFNGAKIFLNMANISILEMPLGKIEEAILDSYKGETNTD